MIQLVRKIRLGRVRDATQLTRAFRTLASAREHRMSRIAPRFLMTYRCVAKEPGTKHFREHGNLCGRQLSLFLAAILAIIIDCIYASLHVPGDAVCTVTMVSSVSTTTDHGPKIRASIPNRGNRFLSSAQRSDRP